MPQGVIPLGVRLMIIFSGHFSGKTRRGSGEVGLHFHKTGFVMDYLKPDCVLRLYGRGKVVNLTLQLCFIGLTYCYYYHCATYKYRCLFARYL